MRKVAVLAFGFLALAAVGAHGQSTPQTRSPDITVGGDEPPAPRQLHCPAMVGPAKFKLRPPSPDDPALMRSNSDTQAGIAKGDPWVMLVATEVCDYASPDGAFTLRIVASKNPDLGKNQFGKWLGKTQAVSLGGLAGLAPLTASADGRKHELYTVRQNADGGILILVDYPSAQAQAVGTAIAAAAATQPPAAS